jgi:alpha-L-fucosidase
MKGKLLFLIILVCFVNMALAQYEPKWESLDKRPTPTWFEDAKFGIFIHWGLYAVPSWATRSNADGFGSGYSEWYWQRLEATNLKIHKEFKEFHEKNYSGRPYQDFAKDFKAELFNPDKWADIFDKAGAKYVVLTSKHHEGYTLWPSKESWNWNSVDLGPKRDIVGDLAKSVKARNLRMGYYYSLYEWFNPVYKKSPDQYVAERMLPQMKDLVTTYKPDVLWTDGEWDQSAKTWRSEEFLAWLFNESPVKNSIVVNDRWGNDTRSEHGSFLTSEYGHGGENLNNAIKNNRPWEENRGIGDSFGYNRNENLEDYNTGKQLVHQLIDIVSRGGNLLLNIGPAADGSIPVIMQQRLAEIGGWLKVNGEAIYGSRKYKSSEDKSIFYTKKGEDLYVFTTDWKDQIKLNDLKSFEGVEMLGFSGKVKAEMKKGVLTITAPTINPGNIPCDYAWVYKVKGALK